MLEIAAQHLYAKATSGGQPINHFLIIIGIMLSPVSTGEVQHMAYVRVLLKIVLLSPVLSFIWGTQGTNEADKFPSIDFSARDIF